jgi:hypothetical protein
MKVFRQAVAAVLLLVAVAFVVGPIVVGSADTSAYQDRLDAIDSEDALNNLRTEGAPQQQVVNGWTTISLLELQAQQQNDILDLQSRQLALLLVIALLVGWSVLSQRDLAGNGGQAHSTASADSLDGPPEPTIPAPPMTE